MTTLVAPLSVIDTYAAFLIPVLLFAGGVAFYVLLWWLGDIDAADDDTQDDDEVDGEEP